ncbi:MAG: hypothetical protein WCE30_06755 [Mycobacterium sp.]
MQTTAANPDVLRLAQHVLSLARGVLDSGVSVDGDEIRWPVENALVSVQGLSGVAGVERELAQRVMDGLSAVLVRLPGERSARSC